MSQAKLGTLDKLLDCFCGSGTTAAVAEKLGRHWIACDLGRFAIHTTRKRLLSIDNVRPFVVQNLGKYERQAWQADEFADPTQRANLQLRYRNFIVQLFHATPIEGYSWIHGVKGGRLVHVGSVDAPIALGEVRAIVNEFWRVRGKDVGEHSNGIDILGWDFAFDLNETAKQIVGKIINSPLLTHKVASSLSLIRTDILCFSDAYPCPNLQLTRKPARKSCTEKTPTFALRNEIPHLIRARNCVNVAMKCVNTRVNSSKNVTE